MHDKNLGGLSCLVGSALPSILIFFKTKNNKKQLKTLKFNAFVYIIILMFIS